MKLHNQKNVIVSRSAEVHHESMSYLTSMKKLVMNKNYMSICIAVGGAVGYFNCLATQLQQFMCSRGYSDEFSGQHKFLIFLQHLLNTSSYFHIELLNSSI